MAQDPAVPAGEEGVTQRGPQAQAGTRLLRGDPLDPAYRRPLERHARLLPVPRDLLASAARVGSVRGVGSRLARVPGRVGPAGPQHVGGGVRRRDVHPGKKRGDCVGKTRRGKGTKLVVVGSGKSVPLAQTVASASPSTTKLIEPTLDKLTGRPRRAVMDREFSSDRFRDRLAARGIDPIIPYKSCAKGRRYDDGRKLRRYGRRWLVERLFAWLGNFRRLVVRYERNSRMFQAFVHVACMLIALRQL